MRPVPLRVGLLGGESTGKSTLARALAEHSGAVMVPEELRAFVERAGRHPRPDEQRALYEAQVAAEARGLAAAVDVGAGIVVCDPAPLMTAVYSVVYFDDDSLMDAAAAHAAAFDVLLWCWTDLPWRADGAQRDGPRWRDAAHDELARVVADRGLAPVEVRGAPAERVSAAHRAIEAARRRLA